MSCLALAAFGKILSYHSTLASLRLREAQKKEKEAQKGLSQNPQRSRKTNCFFGKKISQKGENTRFLLHRTKLSSPMFRHKASHSMFGGSERGNTIRCSGQRTDVKKERFPRGFMCVCVCVSMTAHRCV